MEFNFITHLLVYLKELTKTITNSLIRWICYCTNIWRKFFSPRFSKHLAQVLTLLSLFEMKKKMLKCSMNNGKDPLDSPQDVLRKLLVIYSFNIFFITTLMNIYMLLVYNFFKRPNTTVKCLFFNFIYSIWKSYTCTFKLRQYVDNLDFLIHVAAT